MSKHRAPSQPENPRHVRQPVPDPDAAGQSGDDQQISNTAEADSESVEELLDEGQSFEAGIVSGVEEAGDSPEREVHTHQFPEDDVPPEYQQPDQ